ncbi:amino acid ABC transporter substrate-binding protein [soil metagenome]
MEAPLIAGRSPPKGETVTLRRRPITSLALVVLLALFGAACSSDDDGGDDAATDDGANDGGATDGSEEAAGGGGQESGGGRLADVQDRGTLNCGVNDAVPGFGFTDEAGEFSGFDIEFCRVVAAAVLGDAEAVEFIPITADQRFPALQSGEIDVLIRNTTRTATRDGAEGAAFTTTTFYDGQGMMVRSDAGFTSIDDMGGTTICVLSGTTTELNLATRFVSAGLAFTPLTFPDNEQLPAAFVAGQCDGWTSDKSQLAGVRSAFPEAQGGPSSLVILDETFSKEPLGPVVQDGDDDWFDAVNWAVMATIQAEEFELTSANVEQQTTSDDLDILRFLGQPVAAAEGEEAAVFDPGLGLPEDFALTVITEVGNYGEIYDRNVGPDSPLGLERGLNALWSADEPGLLYAPPYR